VVQKLIATVNSRNQIALLRSAIQPDFLDLVKDLNGNHVIQRCLQYFSCKDNEVYITLLSFASCVTLKLTANFDIMNKLYGITIFQCNVDVAVEILYLISNFVLSCMEVSFQILIDFIIIAQWSLINTTQSIGHSCFINV